MNTYQISKLKGSGDAWKAKNLTFKLDAGNVKLSPNFLISSVRASSICLQYF